MTAPLWLIELGIKAGGFARAARAFICTRWWPGWVAAGLLALPLGCSYRALGAVRADLKACQDAATAPKPASMEKGSASSAVRVTVRHGAFDSPVTTQSLATGSSWPASPCPDVVVEAGSEATFSREETPVAPVAPVIVAPASELWTDIGYNLGPVAGPQGAVRYEFGRGAAWASAGFMGGQPTWGIGAGYCVWRR